MNICVVAGSPKGKNSITYHTVRYLELLHPEHTFVPLFVGNTIHKLGKDMSGAIRTLEAADMILFCYPVYTFMAPSQLHHFVRLLKENMVKLAGKPFAQITTSKHFYDVTAHAYIRENAIDMGMLDAGTLSQDMEDLTTAKGQKEIRDFFDMALWRIQNDLLPSVIPFVPAAQDAYIPSCEPTEKLPGHKIAVVTVMKEEDTRLRTMIADFCACYPYQSTVFNMAEYPFKGGCLGCMQCAASGHCIHKDGFEDHLRNDIQSSDAVVYAFTIEDHSMGWIMKMYDDRQFCNGHRTVLAGKPTAYIINGDLKHEENLQRVIKGRSEVGNNPIAGIGTDVSSVHAAAVTLAHMLETGYTKPMDFDGVGGSKIFRDLIWQMQGLMREDHRFFRQHGFYNDFPQKHRGRMLLMYLVGSLFANQKLRQKLGTSINDGMLAPYRKVLARTEEQMKAGRIEDHG